MVSLSIVCLAGVTLTAWIPSPAAPEPDKRGTSSPSPGIGALAAYAFGMGAGMSTLATYLPLYGEDQLDLGRTSAGALLAVLGIGGVISRVWWSRLSERRSGVGGEFIVMLGLALGALAAAVVVLIAPELGSWSLWLGAALLGLTASAWNAVAVLTVLEHAPAGSTGLASGRVVTTFYLGLSLGAPAFGALVDLSDDYRFGWALTAMSFALAAIAAGVASAERSAGSYG